MNSWTGGKADGNGDGNSGGTWDYDSTILALHEPGLADDCFRLAPRYDPPALCAEMARLVYCADLDRVTTALRRAGFGSPSWFRAAGTDRAYWAVDPLGNFWAGTMEGDNGTLYRWPGAWHDTGEPINWGAMTLEDFVTPAPASP